MRRLLLSALLVSALAGCEGAIVGPPGIGPAGAGSGNGGTGGNGGGNAQPAELGLVSIRRLNRVQYENALKALFPGNLGATFIAQTTYPSASPKTGLASGFSSDSENGTVSTQDEILLEDGSESMASLFLANATTFLPQLCPSLSSGFTDAQVDACVSGFIDDFGRRAFRRPLTATERTSINALYTSLRVDQSAAESFSALLQYFFEAPAFLYRAEKGTGTTGVVTLTPHELATRLAFLLTDAPPDAALLAVADDGTLTDPTVLHAQAERLLGNSLTQPTLARFVREWLRIDLLESLDDADVQIPAARRDALLREVEALTATSFNPSSGSMRDLFGVTQLPSNAQTATFYSANGDVRRGVLSSAGFLIAHAPAGHQTPIIRGAFVRKDVLCQPLATLPGNVDINSPLNDTRGLPTARERLAPTTMRTDCMGCHRDINPLGLALERYDSLGRFRTTENGATLDTSGTITFPLANETWTFSDADAFLAQASQSPMVTTCATQRFFRFALGRQLLPAEVPYLTSLGAPVTETGGTVRSFVFPLLDSEAFTSFRREDSP
ncbi:MAG: DUF1588 domain-containing protein [Archangium sp.]